MLTSTEKRLSNGLIPSRMRNFESFLSWKFVSNFRDRVWMHETRLDAFRHPCEPAGV